MCRAKSDERHQGGRRCPGHARERVMRINESLKQLEVELVEGRNAHENALNDLVRESINQHLAKLAEQKELLEQERNEVQEVADKTVVGIEAIRKEAQETTDSDKKAELLKRANELEKQMLREKEERKKAFMKQSALMFALEQGGVPKHERDALLESIHSDTGSSNLRSWQSYQDRIVKAKATLENLKEQSDTEMNAIYDNTAMSEAQQDKAIDECDRKWNRKIDAQKVLIDQLNFNKYQTPYGMLNFQTHLAKEIDKQKALIDLATKRGDEATANRLTAKLMEFQGEQIAKRQLIEETRNIRLSDRALRDGLKGRIRKVMKDSGANNEQIQTALNAYAKPDAYEAFTNQKRVNGWEETRAIILHVTPTELEQLQGTDRKTVKQMVLATPKLPQGQTLKEVHESFQRTSDGGAHRQRTVMGEKRSKITTIRVKQSQLAIIDAHAGALGISRSAYMRGMAVTQNPFALLNDRSEKTRDRMKRKALEFVSQFKGEKRDKLEKAGGNYWAKGGFERVYFDTKEAYALAGGKIRFYNKSGRTESASIPGLDRISNNNSHAKAYYDLKEDKIVVEASDDRVKEAIEKGFKKLLA